MACSGSYQEAPLAKTPSARLRTPSGREFTVFPGGILGRGSAAACLIPDARVSEAHAMISLRGRELRMLRLRGTLRVDGAEESDLSLESGLEIELAEGVRVRVLEVEVPERVLALQLGDRPPRELMASVYCVTETGELVPRYLEAAPARVWSTGEGWVIQLGEGRTEVLRPGGRWEAAGLSLRAVSLSLAEASAASTMDRPRGYAPLQLVLRFTSVHIHRKGRVPVLLQGLAARALGELAQMGCPVHWETVARELWRDDVDAYTLRNRWDRVLRRLRQALEEAEIREDLVRVDGRGNIELLLLPSDEVIDES